VVSDESLSVSKLGPSAERIVWIRFWDYLLCEMSELRHSDGWHGRHSVPNRRNQRGCSPVVWELGRARRRRSSPRRVRLSEVWKGSALRRLSDQRFSEHL